MQSHIRNKQHQHHHAQLDIPHDFLCFPLSENYVADLRQMGSSSHSAWQDSH